MTVSPMARLNVEELCLSGEVSFLSAPCPPLTLSSPSISCYPCLLLLCSLCLYFTALSPICIRARCDLCTLLLTCGWCKAIRSASYQLFIPCFTSDQYVEENVLVPLVHFNLSIYM